MPDVLGHDVKEPKGIVGRFDEPTPRTTNAIEYIPLDFRKIKSLNDVKTSVFVQNQFGNVTPDHISYFKYQFGAVRIPSA